MKTTKKRLYFIFGLCSMAIICPTIFYSVAKAQEQSGCLTVDPSGQVTIINGSCSPSSQGQESESMANAEEFYQRGSEFDRQGQSQEAIAEYTKAIELDPNHVEAYVFRGNALALVGEPQKGIEDLQKAAAIYESRGESQWAEAVQQQEGVILQGIEDGEF
jgi:tetratricopeptide (TPR) repeat protein